MTSIQSTLQSRLNTLSPASRRIAQRIIDEPRVAVDQTITGLARLCHVSETSIVRFCHSVGLVGYSDLRLRLAAEIGRESAEIADGNYGSDLGEPDNTRDTVSRIAHAEDIGIRETASNLDTRSLERIVDAITAARAVVIFGVGASGLAARDLTDKLTRIGVQAFTYFSVHDAIVKLAGCSANDVLIGFSHSGSTRETLNLVRFANDGGLKSAAITNAPGSPLERAADFTVHTSVRESEFRSGAMASRTAQLMIADCLFVLAAQRDHATTIEYLKKTREATRRL